MNASGPGQGRPLSAREWCARGGLVAAINASMYQTDHRTSVSLMKTATHVNNPRLSKDRTVLAFDRLDASVPPVALIDLDCDDFGGLRGKYGTLVQSIRMISCRGANVWTQRPQHWSTAAIGRDAQGRVLFIHVRSPYSTHDLIDILVELPLGIERAMYVEGGPEAQLYVNSGGREREWVGGVENHRAWPVPNVIGIARRAER
jgi:phosphodiester glycosidase